MKENRTKYIVLAAMTASIYAATTLAFAPISYGPVQLRVSEALTVLPFFFPSAVPGLFIGCIIANFTGMMFSGLGMVDVVVGSLATLLAAYMTSRMKKKYLAPLPPVIVNGIAIGAMLSVVFDLPLVPTMIYVSAGQLAVCYGLGYPLILVIEKLKRSNPRLF